MGNPLRIKNVGNHTFFHTWFTKWLIIESIEVTFKKGYCVAVFWFNAAEHKYLSRLQDVASLASKYLGILRAMNIGSTGINYNVTENNKWF